MAVTKKSHELKHAQEQLVSVHPTTCLDDSQILLVVCAHGSRINCIILLMSTLNTEHAWCVINLVVLQRKGR